MRNKVYYEKLDDWKYRLCEEYAIQTKLRVEGYIHTAFISLSPSGVLTIKKGYAWDGASGPTIDTKSTMRGSLVHDALYQLGRLKLLPENGKALADKLFYFILKEDGTGRFRSWYYWRAVVLFGNSAYTSQGPKKKVLVAP